MNGLEKITSRITSDVEREIAAIDAQAQAECAEIRAKYAAEAQSVYDALMAEGRAEAESRRGRTESMAKLEQRKALLQEKQNLLARCFDLAVEKLRSLPDDEYVALLAQMAADASETGHEELVFSQADRARFGKLVCIAANEKLQQCGKTAELRLSAETRDIIGGLILVDGRVEMNCALDVAVENLRAEMTPVIASVLFG